VKEERTREFLIFKHLGGAHMLQCPLGMGAAKIWHIKASVNNALHLQIYS